MNPLVLTLAPLLFDALRKRFHAQTGGMTSQAVVTPALVEAAIHEATQAPEVKNATNSEPLWRSRVVNGSVGALLGAVTLLVGQISAGTFDLTDAETIGAIGVLLGAAYALFGRVVSGLKPMWSRLFGERTP